MRTSEDIKKSFFDQHKKLEYEEYNTNLAAYADEIDLQFDNSNNLLNWQDYIQENLVMHFDGIQNTLSGHSDSINTWYDLTGNGYDLIHTGTLNPNKHYWENNAFTIEKDSQIVSPLWYSNKTFPTVGNNYLKWTVELIFKVSNDDTDMYNRFFNIYKLYSELGSNERYWYGPYISTNRGKIVYDGQKHYQSFSSNIMTFNSNIFYLAGYIQFPYLNNAQNCKVFLYSSENGLFSKIPTLNNYSSSTISSYAENFSRISLFGGRTDYYDYIRTNTPEQNNSSKMTIYACRLYNRQLTEEEILHNAQIDAIRFGF